MQFKIVKDWWKKFWNAEEIRLLVLASLCLQFGLVFLSPWRKRTAQRALIFLLWCFYLAADYIAILALGNILKKQNEQNEQNSSDLTAFWAPFLLLHLGGPDMITSYSIEDNELWLRHLIGLVIHVTIAFLVILGLFAIPMLCIAAVFIFSTGLVKYAERTWALRSASMDQLRESLDSKPDAGPNYAEFMEEYVRRREAGQGGYITKKNEASMPQLPSDRKYSGNSNDVKLIIVAYEFFKRFKPIVVDLMLTFQERKSSQAYFWESNVSHAFEVVDMELLFLYDVFHTKAINIHGICGGISRFIYLAMISVAFIFFHNCDKKGYVNADIIISYILLGSALFMELTSLVLITTSNWMIVALTRHTWLSKLADVITWVVSCIFSNGKPRWSNSMSLYNLLSFSMGDKESWFRRILGALKVRKLWDKFIFVNSIGVPCKLKALLFQELVAKSSNARHTADFKELRDCKGEKALQLGRCSHLKWSIDKEFDESILLWHIATDLCFHTHGYANENCETDQGAAENAHVNANENCETDQGAAENAHVNANENCETDQGAVENIHCNPTEKCEICKGVIEHINVNENGNSEAGQGVIEHIKRLVNFCGSNDHISYSDREISMILSNYMVYLLIMQPSMMPAGIGKRRFQDTCAEAKVFFGAEKKGLTEAEAREALLNVETEVDPIQVKGDRCKSVLFYASRLAKELNVLPEDERWSLISKVWVEMLGYAAINCKTNYHVKQLSQGGELLTHVWLLMAHMGIGEQYRVETGRVEKILMF